MTHMHNLKNTYTMEIYIVNKKTKPNNIEKKYPKATVLDLTSMSTSQSCRELSPFYPWGDIPIPLESKGEKGTSVEGIWQGLKVFEKIGVDFSTINNNTRQNIKRTVRKNGIPKGHQNGVYGKELLGYLQARMEIYIPTYKWVLDNKVSKTIQRIIKQSKITDLVFLDYNTNEDVCDISKPLSHAALVKQYILGIYPDPSQPYEVSNKKVKKSKRTTKKTKTKQSTKDTQTSMDFPQSK